jgi:hypothetical protein
MTHAEHVAFASALATALGPLGVKRVKIGGVELEFHEPTPAMVELPAGGKTSLEDLQAQQMDSESSTDPLDDPSTFNGRAPPSYGAPRKKKNAQPWPELDTEGQE